jgi:hypothetical protein
MRMWKVAGTRRHNGAHPGAAGAHRLGDPCAGGGISAVAETLVLLRYVELQSRLFRLISLFKVREGAFDPTIRQFVITDRGIVVGEPFEGVEAILSGMPRAAALWRPGPLSDGFVRGFGPLGSTPRSLRSASCRVRSAIRVSKPFSHASRRASSLSRFGARSLGAVVWLPYPLTFTSHAAACADAARRS